MSNGPMQLCSASDYRQKKAAGCMGPSSGPVMNPAPKAVKKSKVSSDGFFSNHFSKNQNIEANLSKGSKQGSNGSLIDRVIDAQLADGSWKDLDLIGLILNG